MGKLNIGKKLDNALNEARNTGITPFEFEKGRNLPFGRIKKLMEKWEEKGKVTCIEKNRTPYLSTYALTKYTNNSN